MGKSKANIEVVEDEEEKKPMTCTEKAKYLIKCGCCFKKKNEEDDWSVIHTPVFSSGESDEEGSR